MHVALRRAQFLVACEFLYRSGRCALHCEMRTERVPENVHAPVRKARPSGGAPHVIRDHLGRESAAFSVAEYSRPFQVSDLPKIIRQPSGHRDVANPPSFRCRHVPMPIGALDAQLSLAEIHVSPLERCDFATRIGQETSN